VFPPPGGSTPTGFSGVIEVFGESRESGEKRELWERGKLRLRRRTSRTLFVPTEEPPREGGLRLRKQTKIKPTKPAYSTEGASGTSGLSSSTSASASAAFAALAAALASRFARYWER